MSSPIPEQAVTETESVVYVPSVFLSSAKTPVPSVSNYGTVLILIYMGILMLIMMVVVTSWLITLLRYRKALPQKRFEIAEEPVGVNNKMKRLYHEDKESADTRLIYYHSEDKESAETRLSNRMKRLYYERVEDKESTRLSNNTNMPEAAII